MALSVRMVYSDYYMSKQLLWDSEQRPNGVAERLPRCPVLRIFGSTPRGQKVAVHLHGCFPYFYVPAPSNVVNAEAATRESFLDRMEQGIEEAVASDSERRSGKINAGATTDAAPRRRKTVVCLEYVEKTDFYGYRDRRALFIKVKLFDPDKIKTVSELMLRGALWGWIAQPYESHVGFMTRQFIDLGIAGMAYIHLERFLFRGPMPSAPDEDSASDNSKAFAVASGPSSTFLSSSPSASMQRRFLGLTQEELGCGATDRTWYAGNTPAEMISPPLDVFQLQRSKCETFESEWSALPWPNRTTSCELELDVFIGFVSNTLQTDGLGSEGREPVADAITAVQSLRVYWAEAAQRDACRMDGAQATASSADTVTPNRIRRDRGEDSATEESAASDAVKPKPHALAHGGSHPPTEEEIFWRGVLRDVGHENERQSKRNGDDEESGSYHNLSQHSAATVDSEHFFALLCNEFTPESQEGRRNIAGSQPTATERRVSSGRRSTSAEDLMRLSQMQDHDLLSSGGVGSSSGLSCAKSRRGSSESMVGAIGEGRGHLSQSSTDLAENDMDDDGSGLYRLRAPGGSNVDDEQYFNSDVGGDEDRWSDDEEGGQEEEEDYIKWDDVNATQRLFEETVNEENVAVVKQMIGPALTSPSRAHLRRNGDELTACGGVHTLVRSVSPHEGKSNEGTLCHSGDEYSSGASSENGSINGDHANDLMECIPQYDGHHDGSDDDLGDSFDRYFKGRSKRRSRYAVDGRSNGERAAKKQRPCENVSRGRRENIPSPSTPDNYSVATDLMAGEKSSETDEAGSLISKMKSSTQQPTAIGGAAAAAASYALRAQSFATLPSNQATHDRGKGMPCTSKNLTERSTALEYQTISQDSRKKFTIHDDSSALCQTEGAITKSTTEHLRRPNQSCGVASEKVSADDVADIDAELNLNHRIQAKSKDSMDGCIPLSNVLPPLPDFVAAAFDVTWASSSDEEHENEPKCGRTLAYPEQAIRTSRVDNSPFADDHATDFDDASDASFQNLKKNPINNGSIVGIPSHEAFAELNQSEGRNSFVEEDCMNTKSTGSEGLIDDNGVQSYDSAEEGVRGDGGEEEMATAITIRPALRATSQLRYHTAPGRAPSPCRLNAAARREERALLALRNKNRSRATMRRAKKILRNREEKARAGERSQFSEPERTQRRGRALDAGGSTQGSIASISSGDHTVGGASAGSSSHYLDASGSRGGGCFQHASVAASMENQHLTILSFELHARSRTSRRAGPGADVASASSSMYPDSDHDEIRAIAFVVRDDDVDAETAANLSTSEDANTDVNEDADAALKPKSRSTRGAGDRAGVVYVDPSCTAGDFAAGLDAKTVRSRFLSATLALPTSAPDFGALGSGLRWNNGMRVRPVNSIVVRSELDLIEAFVALVREVDADMLISYEMQRSGLGYLFRRAAKLGVPLHRALSRTVWGQQDSRHGNDSWGDDVMTEFWIPGRYVLNLWRITREYVDRLPNYELECVARETLKLRLPRYSYGTLDFWFEAGGGRQRWRTLRHVVRRAKVVLDVMTHLDVVGRTTELARLFGTDFMSVLTRGSQFRVENVMLRVARSRGFVMPSAGRDQVAMQNPLEELPLLHEPGGRFEDGRSGANTAALKQYFTDPVMVLDFKSLYPSVIISHNLCYSTLVGRLERMANSEARGFRDRIGFLGGFEPDIVAAIPNQKSANNLLLSPTGTVFVPPEVRRGILPTMLDEIIRTRFMIKRELKRAKAEGDTVLARVLDNRQLGLKMIANVTYGYTASSFSGRMPCSCIADTIVRVGRTALERTELVVQSPSASWAPAEVVYGDTDSVFIHLPGRDRHEAFRIGNEISKTVTNAEPSTMELEFEKVYQPCLLVAKKKYCGMKFECANDSIGSFEAKGIETVRRDGCALMRKVCEQTLRLLFRLEFTPAENLRAAKDSVQRCFNRVRTGRYNMRDLVFYGKMRPMVQYLAPPPHAMLAARLLQKDPARKPLTKERVPHVIVVTNPGARLQDNVVDPHELLGSLAGGGGEALLINAEYYIEKKIVPMLNRLLLCYTGGKRGLATKWHADAPKLRRRVLGGVSSAKGRVENVGRGSAAGVRSSTLGSSGQSRATKRRLGLIERYLALPCLLCGASTADKVCNACKVDPQRLVTASARKLQSVERKAIGLRRACISCQGGCGGSMRPDERQNMSHMGGVEDIVMCISLECEVYYERRKVEGHLIHLEPLRDYIM